MKSSKIIFFTLIFHLTISTIAFLELKRNDNFFIDSLNPNNISLINEFRICFKDLMFNPKVIVFKDEVVPNLNDVFNMSSFTLKQLPDEKVYSIDVTFFEKQLILKSKFFNLLNKSSINCIYFKTNSGITSLNYLKVMAQSSEKEGNFNVGYLNLQESFALYNLDDSVVFIEEPSFTPNEVFFDTKPDLEVVFKVKNIMLPLETEKDEMFIIIELPQFSLIESEVRFFNMDENNLTNQLTLAPKSTPKVVIKDYAFKITDFGENLRSGREFKIFLKNLNILQNEFTTSQELYIISKVIWKNTNSVISYSKTMLNLVPKKYNISSASITHPLKDFLYPGSFQVKLTFENKFDTNLQDLILTNGNNLIKFLASTCDFSENIASYKSSKEPRCYSNSRYDTLIIKNLVLKQNQKYVINFWIFIDNDINITQPVIKIRFENLSNENAVNFIPKIIKAYDYNENNYSQSNCKVSSGCSKTELLAKNYSGNFILLPYSKAKLEKGSFSETIDFTKDIFSQVNTPIDLFTLSQSSNPFSTDKQVINYFRLRFRVEISDNTKIYETFPFEITSKLNNSNANQGEDYYQLGTHNFLFPAFFSLNSQQCKMRWFSNKSRKSNVSTFVYNKILDATGTRYDNFIDYKSDQQAVSSNKISIDNFDGTTLKYGFMHNLVNSIVCDGPNCTFYESDLQGEVGVIDSEIVSNCAEIITDLKVKSVYTPFSFYYFFQIKDSKSYTRVASFVSLLPQPGVFGLTNVITDVEGTGKPFSKIQQNILDNSQGYGIFKDMESICIINIIQKDSTVNGNRPDSTKLNLFLNFNLIEFDDMDDYPINQYKSKGYNSFNGLKDDYFTFKITKFNLDSSNIADKSHYYSNTQINNYLGSRIEVEFTAKASSSKKLLYVPIKCPSIQITQIVSVTDIENYTISIESKELLLEPFFYYKSIDETSSKYELYYNFNQYFEISPSLTINSKVNFHYLNNDPLKTTDSKIMLSCNTPYTRDYKLLEAKKHIFVLLSKSSLSNDIKLIDVNGGDISKSSYNSVVKDNNFTLNNVTFNSIAINVLIDPDLFFKFYDNEQKIIKIQISDIKLPEFQNRPMEDNDFGYFLIGKPVPKIMRNLITEDLNEFTISNFDIGSKKYQIDNNVTINEETGVDQVKFLNLMIIELKTGPQLKTLCGNVTVSLPLKIVKGFLLRSPNINENTTFKCEDINKDGVLDENDCTSQIRDKEIKVIINKSDFAYDIKYLDLYFCNISISNNDKFSFTYIEYFFKNDETTYKKYSLSNKDSILDRTISTNLFETPKIEYWRYKETSLNYSSLEIKVNLNISVFYDMNLTIQSEAFSKLYISSKVYCLVIFTNDLNDENYAFNRIFDTCYFIEDKLIITTTKDLFSYKLIPKEFYIILSPVNVVYFQEIKFNISLIFNTTNQLILSDSHSLTSKLILGHKTFDISDSAAIINLEPRIPEMIGKIRFEIDLKNKIEDINKFYETINNYKVSALNEISIYLPIDYYSFDVSELKCYFKYRSDIITGPNTTKISDSDQINELQNDTLDINLNEDYLTQLENCKYESGFIYMIIDKVKTFKDNPLVISDSNTIVLEILGLRVKSKSLYVIDPANISNSEILININSLKFLNSSYIRESFFSAKLNFSKFISTEGGIDIKSIQERSFSTIGNIRIKELSLTSYVPLTETNVNLKFSLDNLNGILSQSLNLEVYGSTIYIGLNPNVITYLYTNGLISRLSTSLSVFELLFETLAEDNNNLLPIFKPIEIKLNTTVLKIVGNYLVIQITTKYTINKSTNYFLLNLSKFYNEFEVQTKIPINYLLFKNEKSKFMFKTYVNLKIFSFNQPTNYVYDNIIFSRDLQLSYPPTKYKISATFIDSNKSRNIISNNIIKIKPGVLFPFEFAALSDYKYFISSKANYKFGISKNSNFVSNKLDYELDMFTKQKITAYFGVPCGTLPGKYLLILNEILNESNQYYKITPFKLEVPITYEKEKIKIYSSPDDLEYSPKSINISYGGYTYFWIKNEMMNIDQMIIRFSVVSFAGRRELQSYDIPKEIRIENYNLDYKVTIFGIDAKANAKEKIKFGLSLETIDKTISCFELSLQELEIYPSTDLAEIPDDFDLEKLFLYKVGDDLDTIIINFNKDKIYSVPINSYLFCSLYCSEISPPSKEVLTTLPFPKNTWFMNYYFLNVPSSGTFNFNFNGLNRNVLYNLKCILQSSNFNPTIRTSKEINLTKIAKKDIKATPTKLEYCLNIEVVDYSDSFKKESIKILQDLFLKDWISTGCIIVEDSSEQGYDVDLYNSDSFLCNKEKINNTAEENVKIEDSSIEKAEAKSETKAQLRTFRNLQNSIKPDVSNSTSTSTITMMEETQEEIAIRLDKEITIINKVKSYNFCMIQKPNCSKDYNTDFVNKALLEILSEVPLRSLQVFTEEVKKPELKTIEFKYRLSQENKSNFINGKIFKTNSDYKTDEAGLRYFHQSAKSAEIINEKVIWKFQVEVQTLKSSETDCLWLLSDKETEISSEKIVSCRNLENSRNDLDKYIIFCGRKSFIAPSIIKATIELKYTEQKQLYFYTTCKQNMNGAEIYSEPQVELFISPFIPIINKNKSNSDTEKNSEEEKCNGSALNFPICCPSGKFSNENPDVCFSQRYYVSFIFLLGFALVMF